MKTYLLLVKTFIRNRFRWKKRLANNSKKPVKKDGGGGSIATYIAVGFLYLYIIALSILGIIYIAPQFIENDQVRALILFIFFMAAIMVVMFGLGTMISTVYFSTDIEFLSSLPVKPHLIFFAKLTVVYVIEFVTTLMLLVPLLVTLGIMAGYGAAFYLGLALALFIVPAIPLLIVTLLAIPLMYAVSFFKNKGAMSTIALILIMALFMGFYMFFAMDIENTIEGIGAALEQIVKVAESVGKILYPLYALANLMLLKPIWGLSVGVSALVSLAIILALTALLIAIAAFIANLVYQRSAIKQTEKNKSYGKERAFRASHTRGALMRKEWREIIRTPVVGFQCLFGVIMSPIMIIVMTVSMSSVEDLQIDKTFILIMNMTSLAMMIIFASGMNVASCSLISREGNNFYLTKIFPVSFTEQIKAKLTVHFMISMLSIITGWVSMVIIRKFDVIYSVLSLAFLVIWSYGYMMFAARYDVKKPKLNWSHPNEVVKNSRNTTIPMLINMGLSLVLVVVLAILTYLLAILGPVLQSVISWSVLLLIAALFAYLTRRRLFKTLERDYNAIGQ